MIQKIFVPKRIAIRKKLTRYLLISLNCCSSKLLSSTFHLLKRRQVGGNILYCMSDIERILMKGYKEVYRLNE